MKTHSGAKKRIKVTKSGKLITAKAWKRHLLQDKSKSAKKRDLYGHLLANSERSRVLRALNL